MAGLDIRPLYLNDLLDKEAVLFNPQKNTEKARGIVVKTTDERFKQDGARYALIARREGCLGYFLLMDNRIVSVDHSTYPSIINMEPPYFWIESGRHSPEECGINSRLRAFGL